MMVGAMYRPFLCLLQPVASLEIPPKRPLREGASGGPAEQPPRRHREAKLVKSPTLLGNYGGRAEEAVSVACLRCCLLDSALRDNLVSS